MDRWIGGSMDRWIDGSMDRWIGGSLVFYRSNHYRSIDLTTIDLFFKKFVVNAVDRLNKLRTFDKAGDADFGRTDNVNVDAGS